MGKLIVLGIGIALICVAFALVGGMIQFIAAHVGEWPGWALAGSVPIFIVPAFLVLFAGIGAVISVFDDE